MLQPNLAVLLQEAAAEAVGADAALDTLCVPGKDAALSKLLLNCWSDERDPFTRRGAACVAAECLMSMAGDVCPFTAGDEVDRPD